MPATSNISNRLIAAVFSLAISSVLMATAIIPATTTGVFA